jgi:hypothetical protein
MSRLLRDLSNKDTAIYKQVSSIIAEVIADNAKNVGTALVRTTVPNQYLPVTKEVTYLDDQNTIYALVFQNGLLVDQYEI